MSLAFPYRRQAASTPGGKPDERHTCRQAPRPRLRHLAQGLRRARAAASPARVYGQGVLRLPADGNDLFITHDFPTASRRPASPATRACGPGWSRPEWRGHRGSRSSRMSDPRPLRPGRGGRPSPASLGVVRVDADFPDEYPGGDATCTEAYASLCRTGEALLGELDRRIALTFGIHQPAATALAVSRRGRPAAYPLAGRRPGPDRLGHHDRHARPARAPRLDSPHPQPRRSPQRPHRDHPRRPRGGRPAAPRHPRRERGILSALTPDERAHLLDLLGKVLARTAEVPPSSPSPSRASASGAHDST